MGNGEKADGRVGSPAPERGQVRRYIMNQRGVWLISFLVNLAATCCPGHFSIAHI